MEAQNRRSAIKNMLAGTAALGAAGMVSSFASANEKKDMNGPLKGNINHSVCPWCYEGISLDTLCAARKEIGLKGIDLAGPAEWPILQKHGLYSPMCNGAEINLTDGFNDKTFHP